MSSGTTTAQAARPGPRRTALRRRLAPALASARAVLVPLLKENLMPPHRAYAERLLQRTKTAAPK